MTAIARRIDVLEAPLRVLQVLESLATPAPWDCSFSWVVAPDVPLEHARGHDAESYRYYGGNLVCESISNADATLVTIARNVMPGFARAHIDLLHENIELRERNIRLEREASWAMQLRAQITPAGVLTIRSTGDGRVEASRVYVRRFGKFASIQEAQRAATAGEAP